MKNFLIAVGLAALMASPALAASNANFVGPRIEATAGVDDFHGNAQDRANITYGARVGVDAPLGSDLTVGVEAGVDNVFGSTREIGVAARVGYAVTDHVLAFGTGGYANYRNIDFSNREAALNGFRVGGGLQLALTSHIFTGVEYRYTGLDHGVKKNSVNATLGIRL